MAFPTPNPNAITPAPAARFVTLDTLLGADGPITKLLYPPPNRRSLIRRLTAAGVPRFKCNGPYAPGRGQVYFDREAVHAWLESNIGNVGSPS